MFRKELDAVYGHGDGIGSAPPGIVGAGSKLHTPNVPRPVFGMKFNRNVPSGISSSTLSVSYCVWPPCGLPKSASRPQNFCFGHMPAWRGGALRGSFDALSYGTRPY